MIYIVDLARIYKVKKSNKNTDISFIQRHYIYICSAFAIYIYIYIIKLQAKRGYISILLPFIADGFFFCFIVCFGRNV